VNPFPLIEVAAQLPERGKCIRQAFEVGGDGNVGVLAGAVSRARGVDLVVDSFQTLVVDLAQSTTWKRSHSWQSASSTC
jgi:hypothetical protein